MEKAFWSSESCQHPCGCSSGKVDVGVKELVQYFVCSFEKQHERNVEEQLLGSRFSRLFNFRVGQSPGTIYEDEGTALTTRICECHKAS
uniref:Ovule protein n=1 Tax=Bursaphelenchus xylophilus TaxID=6326 RepID=A0A1I7SHL8_BURXY